jgi:hypothetical protein
MQLQYNELIRGNKKQKWSEMTMKAKKFFACVFMIGALLILPVTSYALPNPAYVFTGILNPHNPLLSNPYATAETTAIYDVDTIGAKIKVYYNGAYVGEKTTGTQTN